MLLNTRKDTDDEHIIKKSSPPPPCSKPHSFKILLWFRILEGNQVRIHDFLQGGGGGVNDGRVQRAPSAPAPTGGLGLINIKLRYIASIEYSERFFLFFFCYS